MAIYALGILATFVISLILTPIVRKFAFHCGLVDQPNARKMHRVPMPRIGGVAVFGSLSLVVFQILFYSDWAFEHFRAVRVEVGALLISSVIVFLLGLVDDLKPLPSKFKLLTILAAAAIACRFGIRMDVFAFGKLFYFNLGWLAWPVTVIWIAGFTVSIAFIDGLDGLAAGIALIASAVIAAVATANGQPILVLMSLSLFAALAGFLVYNFYPAKIFLGDCGSLTIGFLLGCMSILAAAKAETAAVLALPALALGVPIVDTALTLVRRGVLQRRSLFAAERGHVHHRLMDLGLSHRQVVLVLHLVTVGMAAAGLAVFHAPTIFTVLLLIVATAALMTIFRSAGSVRVRETIRAIRRNVMLRRASDVTRLTFEEMQIRFRQAKTFEVWWQEVCNACDKLGFAQLTLPISNRDGTERMLEWRHAEISASSDVVSASIPIRHRRVGGPLRAQIEVLVAGSLEAAGQRMASFARLMEEYNLANLPDDVIAPPVGTNALLLRLATGRNGYGSGSGSGNGNGNDMVCKEAKAPREGIEYKKLPELSLNTIGVNVGVGDVAEIPRPSAGAPKIAVVHDFLYTYAGAERVLEQILNVYPEADLFSLFDFLPEGERQFIQNKPVKTSFIHRMPFARNNHRKYLPLMPLAIEQLDLSAYDIVISSSYVAAKGVITKPDQLHICYCHSPVRYAWDLQGQYLSQANLLTGLKSFFARAVLHYMRNWDVRSATGVDQFITNSDFVGRRVQKVYRRESKTIYPPVDVDAFALQTKKEDFYLTVSRLVPYKKIDLIVDAFAKMPDRRLIVVGGGPDFDKIKAKATPNVKVMGHQSFENLKAYMQRARAFVFAAEEDFGIVPVEAQACGTPVIAYGRGGVLESVIPGRTGIFFHEQTPDHIVDAINRFESMQWDPHVMRQNAMRFAAKRFRAELEHEVTSAWNAFNASHTRQGMRDVVKSALHYHSANEFFAETGTD